MVDSSAEQTGRLKVQKMAAKKGTKTAEMSVLWKGYWLAVM